jgi:ligand-binding SRPBCC domain-containing protein
MQRKLSYETELNAKPEDAWQWITSFDCITKEMMPYMKMTTPKDFRLIESSRIVPGRRLFRSWIKAFGIIPIDYSDLSFDKIIDGKGFLENSTMGTMKYWKHERIIVPTINGCKVIDEVTFEPKLASSLVGFLVDKFFKHRHKRLSYYLSTSN